MRRRLVLVGALAALAIASLLTFTGAVSGGVAATAMDDDFNDNFLDPGRWSMLAPPPGFSSNVSETNQRLEISDGPGAGGAGVLSVCSLSGDFDVQVDYVLLEWPAGNSHGLRLLARDLGAASIERRSDPGNESYTFVAGGSVSQSPTSDSTGSLRLTRTGSTLSGYFLSGSTWVLVGSGPALTGDTKIELDLGTNDPSAPATKAAFDNFLVMGGTVVCPPRPQHYLLYQLDQPEASGETVTLIDQFGSLRLRLEEPEWLLNPADKFRTGREPELASRRDLHYVCYGLPYLSTPDRFARVSNQFVVDSVLRVGRPKTLCTPAAKSLAAGELGEPPVGANHYLCYDVRGETPRFTSETLVAKDQFGEVTIRIDRTRELCNPVEKQREGRLPEPIVDPLEHLVCYRITSEFPLLDARFGITTKDQFGRQILELNLPEPTDRLCVPSTKDGGVLGG